MAIFNRGTDSPNYCSRFSYGVHKMQGGIHSEEISWNARQCTSPWQARENTAAFHVFNIPVSPKAFTRWPRSPRTSRPLQCNASLQLPPPVSPTISQVPMCTPMSHVSRICRATAGPSFPSPYLPSVLSNPREGAPSRDGGSYHPDQSRSHLPPAPSLPCTSPHRSSFVQMSCWDNFSSLQSLSRHISHACSCISHHPTSHRYKVGRARSKAKFELSRSQKVSTLLWSVYFERVFEPSHLPLPYPATLSLPSLSNVLVQHENSAHHPLKHAS